MIAQIVYFAAGVSFGTLVIMITMMWGGPKK